MTNSRLRKEDGATAQKDERLRKLEAALDLAIDRLRAAKNVARQAKDDAKLAKKEKKRARKALISAQEEYGQPATADPQKTPLGKRIAESPERRRPAKKKTSKRAKRARIAGEHGERAIDESVVDPPPAANDATMGPTNADEK